MSFNAQSIKNTPDVEPEMIVKLKGNIEQFDQNFLDLDVNGTVYRILMSNRNLEKLGPIGSQIIIFIYEIIKEDSRIFAGFLNNEERETFGELLTVQGVGGKMALNIMSNLENEVIVNSILNEKCPFLAEISLLPVWFGYSQPTKQSC